MTTSSKLGLAYLIASQSQKEITHNEALNDLDCLVQLSVLSKSLSTPPSSPNDGDAYIVGSSASGEWSGKEKQIAYYYSGWHFKEAKAGWLAFVQSDVKFYVFNSGNWSLLGGFV